MNDDLIYDVDYEPKSHQAQVHFDDHRYRVVVWHRQAGKSTMAVNEMIGRAMEEKGKYFFIAPTYSQVKLIAWDMFKRYSPPSAVRKMNESTLEVHYKNGSQVYLKGADNEDALRGVSLHGVILDEYSFLKGNIWDEIIHPALSVTKGWAMFTGTPKGKNHFYTVYQYGLNGGEWACFHLPVESSGVLDQDTIKKIRSKTSERVFRQEYGAEFMEDGGAVFSNIKSLIRPGLFAYDPNKQYQIGVDLARAEDFTVVCVFNLTDKHLDHFERLNQKDWLFIKTRVESIVRQYGNSKTFVDSTGPGSPIVEDLIRAGLNVEGYRYTKVSKAQLIENLIVLFEQKKVTFPPIEELINELETFTYDVSAQGNISYNAPKGLHDDCVNALALACWNTGDYIDVPKSKVWLPKRMNYS